MDNEYKVAIDYTHPAGKVVFIIPSWVKKGKPATADLCYIWTHQQLEKFGLEDGEVFLINLDTGEPLIEEPEINITAVNLATEQNSLDFHVDNKSILLLRANGDIMYKGKKIENDQQIVDGLKAFVNSTVPWRDPITDPPRKSGTYLVTVQGKKVKYVQEAYFKESSDMHNWIEPYYGQVVTDSIENVVGWMHLPEPYKK